MPRRLRLTTRAQTQREEIWLQVAHDNLRAADRIADRFRDVLVLLADNPNAGPAKPRLGRGIRTFTVEGYVICYSVRPDAIEVLAILHGARNITRRLLEE